MPDMDQTQLMANALGRFPDWADANFALNQGFAHARPDSPYLEGNKFTYFPGKGNEIRNVYVDQTGRARLRSADATGEQAQRLIGEMGAGARDLYARNALAAQRSALAKMGWDPQNTVLNFTPEGLGRGNDKLIAGFYVPPTGQAYVHAYYHNTSPSTLLHESIHHGIHKLQETGYWDPAWNELGTPLPKGSSERWPEGNPGLHHESVVRWLMKNRMGDPEGTNNLARGMQEEAGALFDDPNSPHRQSLDAMEAAASRYLKDKNPRGPR